MKRIVLSLLALCLLCGAADAGGKKHKHKYHGKPAAAKPCDGKTCPAPAKK